MATLNKAEWVSWLEGKLREERARRQSNPSKATVWHVEALEERLAMDDKRDMAAVEVPDHLLHLFEQIYGLPTKADGPSLYSV